MARSTTYVVYKGDDVIAIGSDLECAKQLKVNRQTIEFYATPTHIKRVEKSKTPEDRMIAIRVEESELIE